MRLLDPTSERAASSRKRLDRPQSLKDKRVGLLNISKPKGDIFLDHIADKLDSMGIETRRYQKPTFTRVAPVDLRHQIASDCDLVIEALAD